MVILIILFLLHEIIIDLNGLSSQLVILLIISIMEVGVGEPLVILGFDIAETLLIF